MPKQPTGQPSQDTGPRKTGPTWSAILQIVAAVAVGTALVAGPQLWAFGERLRGDWRRWSTDQWPRSATAPPKASVTSTKPAVIPAAPAPAVKAATSQPPALPVTRATAAKPTKTAKVKQQRPRAARTTLSAPVLLEPRKDPKTYHEMYMKQGIELYNSGWYGPAIGRFRLAAAIIPSPTAYLWIGRAAIRAGRPFEARNALERAIALAPDSAAAREANALLDRMKSDKGEKTSS